MENTSNEIPRVTSYVFSRWLFMRLLGIVYFIAFFSFFVQLKGLIGSNGILPAEHFLEIVMTNLGAKAYWLVPTLGWISSNDLFLQSLAIGGAALSVLLILGVLTVPVLIILWFFYLSLVSVGQVFMSFQWDSLLLETGFLAICLGPLALISRPSRESSPSWITLLLFRLLLFRLIFSSGLGKLTSGDTTWRDFTALNFHYYTQPLPTPVAWYMHQLPEWVHKISVGAMFFIELVIPFLIFAPRRLRFIAAGAIILLQLSIGITGNYTFFNLLTIALCVLLFDDEFLKKFILGRFKRTAEADQISNQPQFKLLLKKAGLCVIAAAIIFLSGIQLAGMIIGFQNIPAPLQKTFVWVSPFRIINNYGLFRVMTTFRSEIIIEGSNDNEDWKEYEFKYKPGDVKRSLPWVEPHQPRLDWQMWFAALGSYESNPWFTNLMVRLLQGSPEVLSLLEKNPFPKEPPVYLRAVSYQYTFTDSETRRTTGQWWQSEIEGSYFPVASLKQN